MHRKPDPEQFARLFLLERDGKLTHDNLEAFLRDPDRFSGGFTISYDQSLGLQKLIERAVGRTNFRNINPSIVSERFPLEGNGTRKLKVKVAPYLMGENVDEATDRLVEDGYTFANVGDLAEFTHIHHAEVERWQWVHVIGEKVWWQGQNNDGTSVSCASVPCVSVAGHHRYFNLEAAHNRLTTKHGILVTYS